MKLILSLLALALVAGCSKSPKASEADVLPYEISGLEARPGCPSGADCTLLTVGKPRPPAKPKPAASSGIRLLISIPQQKLYAFNGTALVATSKVSTGKPGHRTPTGTFRILEKQVTHHSNKYSNAPMPYMQRLTRYGIALHGGVVPGYPASHGCIRLPHAFARKLYRMTSFATRVTITQIKPRSAKAALALL